MSPLSVQFVGLLILLGADGRPTDLEPASAQFTIHDRNRDGVWTRAEIRSPADVLSFLASDQNGDFLVSSAESLMTTSQPDNAAWKAFKQLDVNHDGAIDRAEFSAEQPGAAISKEAASAELARIDVNGDERLSPAEFLSSTRSAPSPTARFRWMDADENGGVTQAELEAMFAKPYRIQARIEFLYCDRKAFADIRLDDWLCRDWKRTRTFEDEFWLRDADSDRQLTIEEFAAWGGGTIAPATRQLFLIFDFDQSGSLSVTEFRAVPGEIPESQCLVPDPIVNAHDAIRDQTLAVLRATQREEWSEETWPRKAIGDVIGVSSLCEPMLWDMDGNGAITLAEVERRLRGAFGLETWTEPPLAMRKTQSQVFNQIYYDTIDSDHDGRLSKDEFIKRYHLGAEGNPKVFAAIDANADGFIDLTEVLSGPWFLTNMVSEFRRLDLDLNGKVDPHEFDKQTHSWHQSLKAYVFPAFDRNRDGFLSLQEFRETPAANQVADWFRAHDDTNADGVLTFDEFVAPAASAPAMKLSLLRKLIFDRFDRNADQRLDSEEFPFRIKPAALTAEASFRIKDRDQSGSVNWEELSQGIAADRQPALRQLFLVFDANGNQQLELAEFRALPDLFRTADRLVPDSLRDARDAQLANLRSVLESTDKNRDGVWKRAEWPATTKLLPLLNDEAMAKHSVWDLDQNGEVTTEELGLGMDLAYGLIDPVEHKWSWHPMNGTVFHGANWSHFDKNRDSTVSHEEFRASYWAKQNTEMRFGEMDRDHDGQLSPDEIFLTPWMWPSVLGEFLRFDANLDGRVSRDELATTVEDWRKSLATLSFPGFDIDGDGFLTWAEYRLTPLGNPVTNWTAVPIDRDGDGAINFGEFWPGRSSFGPLWLCELLSVVFTRLDLNHDGRLEEAEFPIYRMLQVELTKAGWGPDPVRLECGRVIGQFRNWLNTFDRNRDGQLSENEWPLEEVERVFPVARLRSFEVWDTNHDGRVSLEEFQSLLRQAWGITSRRCRSDWLRRGDGVIVDFVTFMNVDLNRDGILSREEFLDKYHGTPAERAKWFKEMDGDNDGGLSLHEVIAGGQLRRSPWSYFQELDRDRDGMLSPEETRNAKAWQKPLTVLSFPTFDDDGDGFLTPAEFRWTPFLNPLFNWTQKRKDVNHDGALSLDEFYTPPPGEWSNWLVLLVHEHFRRWDQNGDGKLTLDEYDFAVDLANLDPSTAFRFADKNHDGGLELAELFLDASPTGGTPAAVIDFHRRKMKSEEAFLGADRDGNRKLSPSEYANYNRYLQGESAESDSTPEIPVARSGASWEDRFLYGFLCLDVLLAIIGGVYWMRQRRAN